MRNQASADVSLNPDQPDRIPIVFSRPGREQSAGSRLRPVKMTIFTAQTGFLPLVAATVLSAEVVSSVCLLVKNLEQRLFARQEAPSHQTKA